MQLDMMDFTTRYDKFMADVREGNPLTLADCSDMLCEVCVYYAAMEAPQVIAITVDPEYQAPEEVKAMLRALSEGRDMILSMIKMTYDSVKKQQAEEKQISDAIGELPLQ